MSTFPIFPGNVRATCPQRECPWWREVPALGTDRLVRELAQHRADEHGHCEACPFAGCDGCRYQSEEPA